MAGRHEHVPTLPGGMKFAQVPVQRLEPDERIPQMDQRVVEPLQRRAIRGVEKFGKRRKRQRQPTRTTATRPRDHVDGQPLIDAVGRAGASPRQVKGDIAARPGHGVALKALHPAVPVARNDDLHARVAALQDIAEHHGKSPFQMRVAPRGVEDVGQLCFQCRVERLLGDHLGGDPAHHPLALQLRNLQTLAELGVEKNTTVVFPAPLMSTIGDLSAFLSREASRGSAIGLPAVSAPEHLDQTRENALAN